VHHPEHLKAICERAKIGRSRRKELLQIGRGSKTIEQSRKESANRQSRSRANRKARAVTVTAPASPHAETDPGIGAKPKPAPSNSMEALAEFQLACDLWLPQLNECDQDKALTHVNNIFEQLRASRGSPRKQSRSRAKTRAVTVTAPAAEEPSWLFGRSGMNESKTSPPGRVKLATSPLETGRPSLLSPPMLLLSKATDQHF
jgi:hypothetical protein